MTQGVRPRRDDGPAGQRPIRDERRGQGMVSPIHTRLWITLWNDGDTSVDEAVDNCVDSLFVHVIREGCR